MFLFNFPFTVEQTFLCIYLCVCVCVYQRRLLLRKLFSKRSNYLVVGWKSRINDDPMSTTLRLWGLFFLRVVVLMTFVHEPVGGVRFPPGESPETDCRLQGSRHTPEPPSHRRQEPAWGYILLKITNRSNI